MIQFYRRIRQDLLIREKFRRYLLYAVGEIVLVVIGILIALSINNWNEERKLDHIEDEILTDLKLALSSDIEDQFNEYLTVIDRSIGWADNILSHINNDSPYSDDLGESFVILSSLALNWTPDITTYSNLETGDMKLIKNKVLRNAISGIYNKTYPLIDLVFNNYKRNVLEYGRPITRSEFIITDPEYYSPIDYESLIKTPELINTVNILKFNLTYIRDDLLEARKGIESVITMIDKELNTNNHDPVF